MTDVQVTEFTEIEPDELHLVGNGANGFKALLAKSASEEVREVLETIADATGTTIKADSSGDADDDRPKCDVCSGSGRMMEGHRRCGKCKGSGVQPKPGDTEKSLSDLAALKEAGVAASGQPVPVPAKCPTCNGSGTLPNETVAKTCPDCGGTGKDAQLPTDARLNTVTPQSDMTSNDGNGRTTIDKALADYDEFVKAKYKQADRDKMADAGQAMNDGAYPIKDAEDLDNAIKAVGRGGADHDSIRKHIMDRAKALNLSSKIPDNWGADGSLGKAVDEPVEKDGIVSDGNPFVTNATTSDADTPGSPAWEAVDAQTATDAVLALTAASELIRTFMQRESIEVAAGEGNDIFDAWAAESALCGLNAAIGVMAQLAFHEGLEAAKSLPDDEVVEKAGRRLAGKTVGVVNVRGDVCADKTELLTWTYALAPECYTLLAH